jgi:hypothetical protein
MTAARGPRGSIGHDGAQGHEADAEAAADATRTGRHAPDGSGGHWRRDSQVWLQAAPRRCDLK